MTKLRQKLIFVVVLVRTLAAFSLVCSAVIMMESRDRVSQEVADNMDRDPMLDSVPYLELIETIVDLNYGPAAAASLVLAAILLITAVMEWRRKRGNPLAGWITWLIAAFAACIVGFGARSGFSLHPGMDFDLVYRYFVQVDLVIVDLAMAVIVLNLLVFIPLANLLAALSAKNDSGVTTLAQ